MIACEDTCGVTAVNDVTGELAAVAVFDSFTHTSALAHIAITNRAALRAGFLSLACHFIYEQCKRLVLYSPIAATNTKAVAFCRHVGFSEVIRLKDGYDKDIDYVLLEMRKDACKWLKTDTKSMEAQ